MFFNNITKKGKTSKSAEVIHQINVERLKSNHRNSCGRIICSSFASFNKKTISNAKLSLPRERLQMTSAKDDTGREKQANCPEKVDKGGQLASCSKFFFHNIFQKKVLNCRQTLG